MKKDGKGHSILASLKSISIKLLGINDTPQKIALGLGLGVFSGILPTTGPIAALFLAWAFRANRASALLGALLTNTWLSIVTFLLSIKVGSAIMKTRWESVLRDWALFLKDFHWLNLFKLSVLKIILPVIAGYLIIAFCIGLLCYLITLIIAKKIRHAEKSRIDISPRIKG
jgi:uncharacterized protein (DUF2062 family)